MKHFYALSIKDQEGIFVFGLHVCMQSTLAIIFELLKTRALIVHMGLDVRIPVFRGLRTTKGADQPAHPRSLISTFLFTF